MTRRLAWAFWFLPLRFQQALITETYEQWIKRARFQPGLLGELIAVLPRARLPQHGGDQFARLSRVVRLACHRYNVNICRVYCQVREPRKRQRFTLLGALVIRTVLWLAKNRIVHHHHNDNECKISRFGRKFAFTMAGTAHGDRSNGVAWNAHSVARRAWEKESPKHQRTFSPYFWDIGGAIPFIRRYSTICP
jgi:hypothetical protein